MSDLVLILFYYTLKTFRSNDLLQLHLIGPVPGDIAEVEAYCRIFRAAERLHNSLMYTLCNPLTGECSVSYNLPSEDRPLLEDKIVSVLGCMICLLNKGKEDVLSGRSSNLNIFDVANVNVRDDRLPPLALFRGEMKRYCESLHVALEDYLTPDDGRNIDVWRKLQRLKSVCYDSGFPRGDGDPCHTLFANWNPVYLSTSKEDAESTDSEVAFWKGSQLTEEGLKWLMEKGFKTIVDLRAEHVKDNFYEIALVDAILSRKIELVKLPVEVGTAPSMEQVEKFAALVSNSSKMPIYLHSREGVWRTSSMVTRWRQYMARQVSQFVSKTKTTQVEIQLQEDGRMEEDSMSTLEAGACFDHENGLLPENLDSASRGLNHISLATGNKDTNSNGGAYVKVVSCHDTASIQSGNTESGSLTVSCKEINPFNSQMPPCNIFSRKEMTRFLRNKKISLRRYVNHQQRKVETLCHPQGNYNGTFQGSKVIGTSSELRFIETGITNGSASSKNLTSEPQSSLGCNGTYLHASSGPTLEGFGIGERHLTSGDHPVSSSSASNNNAISIREIQRSNDVASTGSTDDGLGPIGENMCASATGVVRVQSRKKAEMFLVRTDGFSCSREKVTESSLAFTHPSTQQQMLMWKSTPKTVLLLKKLGQELMEEAKEVAHHI